jgi:nucleotide-binding universal stress UspA family protein
MDRDRQQRIVVGISGSAASQAAALAWAAREARLRQATLRVVRTWEPGRHVAPYAPASATATSAERKEAARGELAAAVRAVFGTAVPAGVTAELVEGVAERVLVDRSADADLIVLGVTSQGRAEQRPAGPVVRACLAHSCCPVVIVGADGTATRSPASAGRDVARPARPAVVSPGAGRGGACGPARPVYAGHRGDAR